MTIKAITARSFLARYHSPQLGKLPGGKTMRMFSSRREPTQARCLCGVDLALSSTAQRARARGLARALGAGAVADAGKSGAPGRNNQGLGLVIRPSRIGTQADKKRLNVHKRIWNQG